jgi:hypothetical protein
MEHGSYITRIALAPSPLAEKPPQACGNGEDG